MSSAANQLQLSGRIVNTPQRRVSPAGIAHAEFILAHDSLQYAGSLQKKAVCRLPVVVSGDLYTQHQAQLIEQAAINVTGYLTTRRSRSGHEAMIIYAQHLTIHTLTEETTHEKT